MKIRESKTLPREKYDDVWWSKGYNLVEKRDYTKASFLYAEWLETKKINEVMAVSVYNWCTENRIENLLIT